LSFFFHIIISLLSRGFITFNQISLNILSIKYPIQILVDICAYVMRHSRQFILRSIIITSSRYFSSVTLTPIFYFRSQTDENILQILKVTRTNPTKFSRQFSVKIFFSISITSICSSDGGLAVEAGNIVLDFQQYWDIFSAPHLLCLPAVQIISVASTKG